MNYTYQHAGETYTISLEQQPDHTWRATINGQSYTASLAQQESGGWLLSVDNVTNTVYCAARDDQRFVQLGSQNFTLTAPSPAAQRRRLDSHAGDLAAQMPGQITSIAVNTGDIVERGQTLLVLEAMKMEIRIRAPQSGQIKRLLVQVGQVVERGQMLIEFEASSPEHLRHFD